MTASVAQFGADTLPALGKPRRSVSGVRGTVSCLDGGVVADYAHAFAAYLRGVSHSNTVVAARDTRPSSYALCEHAIHALLDSGWDVIDLGVTPTPTAQLAVHALDAAGGVVVTASHNPVEYNGVKFLQNAEGHGMFLREDQVAEVFAIYDAGQQDRRRSGRRRAVRDLAAQFDVPPYTADYLARTHAAFAVDNAPILDYHLHRVIAAMGSDVDRIRARSFRVAMDACGGAGVPIDFVLLDYLYAQVTRINDVPGVFPRGIEPIPANLAVLCAQLERADQAVHIGFVTDCDNDRCVLIARAPESGRYVPLEEDYTFAIAVDQVLSTQPPGRTVVTNWSTSQMIKDICTAHSANLRRVPTGEVYTARDAKQFRAALAGEGSCAGVIDPRVGLGRDVLVAIWHVLAALAHRKQDAMTIARSFPRHWKTACDCTTHLAADGVSHMIERLQVLYAGKPDIAFISREDGLIVAFRDHSRVQIRSSNTEPLLRIRTSSPDEARANALATEAVEAIRGCARGV